MNAMLWLLLSFLVTSCAASTWQGRVVGIATGDTLLITRDCRPVRIKLHGVRTPRLDSPLGLRAKQFTSAMVYGKMVRVKVIISDRRGRSFATVHHGARSLRDGLLLSGLGWHDLRHDPSAYLVGLEREAMRARRGVWRIQSPLVYK